MNTNTKRQSVRVNCAYLCLRFCAYAFAHIHTNLYVFVRNLHTFVRNYTHLCLQSNIRICVRLFPRFPFMCNEVEGAHKCIRLRNYWHKQKKSWCMHGALRTHFVKPCHGLNVLWFRICIYL